MCKESCFFFNLFLFASIQYQNCVLTPYCLRNLILEFHIEIVQHRRNVGCKYNDEWSNEEFDNALASFYPEPHTVISHYSEATAHS